MSLFSLMQNENPGGSGVQFGVKGLPSMFGDPGYIPRTTKETNKVGLSAASISLKMVTGLK